MFLLGGPPWVISIDSDEVWSKTKPRCRVCTTVNSLHTCFNSYLVKLKETELAVHLKILFHYRVI